MTAILVVAMAVQTWNRQWSTDVWDHAGVLRAFMVDLLSPAHPQVAVDAPHPFMTPYSWVLGLLARAIDVFPALQVGAMANLVLLLAGLWLFCRRVSTHPAAPALALVLTLVWWGPRAWRYSGFLHLNALGFTLPYPSIFALALALVGLALFLDHLEDHRRWRVAVLAAIAAVVLLTHPIAAILLFGGMAAFAASAGSVRGGLVTAGVAGVALAAGLAWPFYPLLGLLGDVPQGLHLSNRFMYEQPLLRTAPIVLAGIPVLWVRARRHPLDPLVLIVIGLGAIYAFGGLTDAWSWGRVVAPAVLITHVAMADWLAGSELLHDRRAQVAGLALVAVGLVNLAPGLARTVPRPLLPEQLATAPQLRPIDERYRFLEDAFDDGDVVIAPAELGLIAAAYGAKTIAPPRPHPFVPDADERLADLHRFWQSGAAERAEIADRYDAAWVLTTDAAGDVTLRPVSRTMPKRL